jgi:hypothetical protein
VNGLILKIGVAAAIAAFFMSAGCQADPPAPEQRAGLRPSPAGSPAIDPGARMTIVVTDVRGDASVDHNGVRTALGDAETALLSCADEDGSTGVVVMKIPIERDGSVADIAFRETTTYGSEDTRACMRRIVGAMRFVPAGTARAEVEVTLEVRTRFKSP